VTYKQEYPKKIYLELTTIPACNFGCLWHEDKINSDDVEYILASEYEKLKQQYDILLKTAGTPVRSLP